MKCVGVVLLCFISHGLLAQTEPVFSQYMFNMAQVNPAYAGSGEKINATLFYKKQWVGFDGGPVVQSFSASAPLSYNRVGLGLQVQSESQSIYKQLSVNLAYSYKIKINKGLLAFGLYGGIQQSSIDYSGLSVKDVDDRTGTVKSLSPDFGAGIYYHKKKYYLGLSAKHLMRFNSSSDVQAVLYKQQFYGTAGYLFSLSSRLEWIPSCLIKYADGSPVQVDVTSHLKYDKKLWFGISYRSNDAVSMQAGMHLGELLHRTQYDIKIGYAYDITVSAMNHYNRGTHEIMVSLNLGKGKTIKQLNKKKTMVSPLFF